jgi:glycosyltransferase involved in cell wall biosynthesis
MSKNVKPAVGRSDTSALQHWLVLTQYYAPEMGAPQIRLRCFVRELLRHGKDVSVTTAMPNYPMGRIFDEYRGRLFSSEQVDGIHVRRVWAYAATGRAALARFLNYCSFAVNAIPVVLFGRRPDVIFVEAQPLPLGIVALLMKALRGVPYVYNVPDLQVDVARELGFLRWAFLLRMAECVETILLKNALSVSTVTQSFMQHFEARGVSSNRITFLPNGADTEFLHPSEANSEYINRFQLQGRIAFVYVGTHAYYHGLDTLVSAAELLKNNRRIRIVMIGDGPERERIRSLAIEKGLGNIVFDCVPYEGTNDLYSVAYASIATLRNVPVAQGMRLSKIFPALSCGVPVIYSGEGEAAELLAQHRCGITVAPEDASALAEAMANLAEDPSLRNELGENGRSFVQHEYSWSTIVDRWLQKVEHPKTVSASVPSTSETESSDTSPLSDIALAGVAPGAQTGAE